ncbi:MAG: hypothetical protein KKD39_06135 [Candidatus Altiarchaeota archaeon]|nr:hypothetical protein [Candidatus Altiarchaeota archaeon]
MSYERKPYSGVYAQDKKIKKDPPLMMIGMVAAAVAAIAFIILLAGAYFFLLPTLTTTTTTTSTTTTAIPTTTTTTSTSTSTTTTSSTTTTTQPPFYACDKKLSKTDYIDTSCQARDRVGKPTGDWHTKRISATIEGDLDESIIDGGYTEYKAKVRGKTCVYKITDISFEVSVFESCIKPIGHEYQMEATLVQP